MLPIRAADERSVDWFSQVESLERTQITPFSFVVFQLEMAVMAVSIFPATRYKLDLKEKISSE
ncbi:unnamed protein product [Cyprideis torosa]|uniref:Uncharacterized protein n=1 Tax=Cyprideis torosa TaxID=163714 RepID=A0A7R8W890_9CRUS|nr:unnamed protein product [Cyprideis torosa]CAG0888351.1 unnamed protein product [Cyprideis torosa]